MLRVTCDTCHEPIDRDEGGWFGVDWTPPPEPVEPDDDGLVLFSEIKLLGQDHEFHFCSVDHLVSWVMERAFKPQPSEADQ